MKLQTALEQLEFFAYHGIYPEEKLQGGKFRVDVVVTETIDAQRNFVDLEAQVNYEQLFQLVKAEMEQPRELIEEVAYRILTAIKQELRNRQVAIEVKITKPDPGGRFGTGAASVCLTDHQNA